MIGNDASLYAGLVGEQSTIDLIRYPPAQETQCLGLAIAGFHPTLYVRVAGSQATPLSDSDPVQRSIHLAISAPIQSMPHIVRFPSGHRTIRGID